MHAAARTRFALSRFWANAICGALGVALGEMAFFLILRTLYPILDIPYRVADTYNAMTMLSYTRPEFYYFVIVLIQIPGCMVMASVALAVSTFACNMYVTLASPIIYVGLVSALPQKFGESSLRDLIYLPTDLDIWQEGYTLFYWHLGYCAVMLAATFAVFWLSVCRYKGE